MNVAYQEFRRDGHTIVSGLLSATEVADLRAALDRAAAKVRADPGAYVPRYTVHDGENVDIWGVNDILSQGLYEPAFGRLFANPALMDTIRMLADGSELRFLGAHALFSPESVDYDLYWHRDWAELDHFDATGGSTHVYMNIALTDDSCLRAIPGSNRRALTPAERAAAENRSTDRLDGEKVVHARAGDIIFTNNHTLHRGSCAASTLRRTLHIGLQPVNDPTRGHTSYKFIRDDGYLDTVPPDLRRLMTNLIAWEDAHPQSLADQMRRVRGSRHRRGHDSHRVDSAV